MEHTVFQPTKTNLTLWVMQLSPYNFASKNLLARCNYFNNTILNASCFRLLSQLVPTTVFQHELFAMVTTSKHIRIRIIKEHARTGCIAAAARAACVSYNTAKRWVQRSDTALGLEEIHRKGRPRVLSEAGEIAAMEGLLNPKLDGADHVAKTLLDQQIAPRTVSKQTIIRAANRAAQRTQTNLRVVRGHPQKKLTDEVKEKRVQFALQHLNTDWGRIVFTDRKRFQFKYPGEKVKPVFWSKDGQRQKVLTAAHPCSVNLYAGLTRYGATNPQIVAGTTKHKSKYNTKKGQPGKTITAAEYRNVLTSTLLPCSQSIFNSQGIQFWVLQQDNDPTHRAAGSIIQRWGQRRHSKPSLLVDWPPHSPDLSPIENFWAWVEARINKMGCKTFPQFQAATIQTIKHAPKQLCAKLVDSMKDRLKKVIQLGGEKLKY